MPKVFRPLDPKFSRLEKIWLYETSTHYYLVGSDSLEITYRLLKINRAVSKPKRLSEILHEDLLDYTKDELFEILGMIHDGNKQSGGLSKVCMAYGLVGFVRFLDCFYFTLITQRKEVGCIGGNFIYSIKATEIFAVRKKEEPNNNAFSLIWKKLNKKLNQTSSEIAESRYMGLFQFVDMSKDFFFSYTYDLTHSLQHNHITSSLESNDINSNSGRDDVHKNVGASQEIFEWNHYQTHELRELVEDGGCSQWVLPIIHGSYQQKRFSFFGKTVDMMVLARRSRHYAGTRYLKRGISVHGKVANDVEVEQILQYGEGVQAQYCSYVQMRGSIPTYWFQETSVTNPKPPILLNRMDPDYLATEEHFSDLIVRYSTPIIVLDLVKQQEKRPRESLVGREFRYAVEVLNESIESEHKIRYIALDYSKVTAISKGKFKKGEAASGGAGKGPQSVHKVGSEWALMESTLSENKNNAALASPSKFGHPDTPGHSPSPVKVLSHNHNNTSFYQSSNSSGGAQHNSKEGGVSFDFPPSAITSKLDVLRELEDIALLTLSQTQFFCTRLGNLDKIKVVTAPHLNQAKAAGYLKQSGVLRTNCIDCLDRTNGGQFAIAMKFLAVSLQALGICSIAQAVEPNSQLLLALMDMFGEMGDKIAMQYGGSEAHKKVLAGKGGQKPGAPKQNELLTSIKRYYSNAFTDMVKQDAMNVFLGCYIPSEESSPLWDLESDYDLHNKSLRPPEPAVSKVLFEDILSDNRRLRTARARGMIEGAVRSVILREKDCVPLISADTLPSSGSSATLSTAASGSTDDLPSVPSTASGDSVPPLPPSTSKTPSPKPALRKSHSSSPDPTGTLSDDMARFIRVIESQKIVPRLELKTVTSKYFIRNMNIPSKLPGGGVSKETATGRKSPSVIGGSPIKQIKLKQTSIGLNTSVIRSIARLEKRKLTRRLASEKIRRATEKWWKESLDKHNIGLYGTATPVFSAPDSSEGTKDAKEEFTSPLFPDTPPRDLQHSSDCTYFNRMYRPDALSEFDAMFTLDFIAPIDAVVNSETTPATATSTAEMKLRKSIVVNDDVDGDEDGGRNSGKAEGDAAESANTEQSSTRFFFLPGLLGSNTAAPTAAASADATTAANTAANRGSRGRTGSGNYGSNSNASFYNTADGANRARGDSDVNVGDDASGFAIARYVRDLGMKARTLVGGLLRKEDSVTLPQNINRYSANKRRNPNGDWNWRQQQISYHVHRVPKASSMLYSKYVAVANDNLILMQDIDKTALRIAEDEYHVLLHDCSIDMDNVSAMEQLSADSYVSSEINTGVYQGMKQYDSAFMTHGFLLTALVNVEAELARCRVHIDSESASAMTSLKSIKSMKSLSSGSLGTDVSTSTGSEDAGRAGSPLTLTSSLPIPNSNTNAEQHLKQNSAKQTFGRDINRNAKAGKMNMELSVETQDRIYHFMRAAQAANGVENEFKKNVSNYIFQQYTYSKDISTERLAKRMSTLSNERTILEYTMLFDQDTLASSFDHMSFITNDTASYQSFSELENLQNALADVERRIVSKKKEMLAEIEARLKVASEGQDAETSEGNDGTAPLLSPSSSPKATLNCEKKKAKSISEQLGLSASCDLSDLHDSLDTDYSLGDSSSVFSHYPYNSSSTATIFGREQDYPGFYLQSTDLYSRTTNHHLSMNEICVQRFNEAITYR